VVCTKSHVPNHLLLIDHLNILISLIKFNKSWIQNYAPYKVSIRLADSRVIYSEGVGSVLFRPLINGQLSRDVEFSRVLHVPALRNNLLAVLYLTKHKNFHIHISSDHIDFERNENVV
jgi:hypothetical protein